MGNQIVNAFLKVLGPLLFLIGIIGNFLIVIAVWKKRSLRSTANYLLLNIAAADIICLVFLPLTLVEKYLSFQGLFSDVLCKFFVSFHVPLTASFASILTLVVLSVERYHAVVKPLNAGKRLREGTVKYAIIAVWITAILLTLPTYIYSVYQNTSKCDYSLQEKYQKIYVSILMSLAVFIPFIVIIFCYFRIIRELYFKNKVEPQNVAAEEDARAKRKLVKFSLSLTSAFILCFFPLTITVILDKLYGGFATKIYNYTGFIFVLQSVLNPFLYTFQSTNFRQAFKEMLKFKLCPCCKLN
ncbi:somatostatin receptor type 5-like [Actinia tenebrosa]|uniref:Somatostatin receptor type 5-like n=1 Tax=Actinia tenebrosa TaxID=6105 RepID=A0A6P8J5F4_ACTTE|nr:somatostatin receptor type 5-like [Actinia tenebrosa]